MNKFYLTMNGEKYGPYAYNQVERWVKEGRINENTLCWYEGLDNWRTLKEVFPNLFYTKVNENRDVPSNADIKKKKRGCFGCLFRILLLVLILGGLYFLISPYVKDYLEEKRADVEYKNFENVKINGKGIVKFKTVTKKIDWRNRGEERIKFGNALLDIFSPFSENEQKIELSKVSGIKIKNGTLLATPIDVELLNKDDYNFPAKIVFKNLSDKIYSGDSYECVSIDSDGNIDYPLSFMDRNGNNLVVISEHFTTFAPVQYKSNLPYSSVIKIPNYFVYKRVKLPTIRAARIIKNFSKNIKYMPPSILNDCWSSFNEWLGITSNITVFSENALYMEGFKKFNNLMPEFGLSLSFLQLGIDLYTGNRKSGILNFTKNAGYYGIGKAFPTRAMNIAMVGVFVIDYSLNKFMNKARSGRDKLYEKIAMRWLQLRRKKGERGKWWYRKLEKVVINNLKNPVNIGDEIDKCFREYVGKLWNDETEIGILHSELNSTAFTAGGGLNEKLKDRLTNEIVSQLKSYNKSVIERLARKSLINQKNYVYSVRRKLISFLNKKHKIEIIVVDGKGKRIKGFKDVEAGFLVKDISKRKFWRKKLGESGRAIFFCTNVGYLLAGSPIKAYLKIPVEDKKFLVIKKKFILKDLKTTKIKFVIRSDDISGVWEGYYQITKNSYFDSIMKIAPYIFKFVGLGKSATKNLAMAKSVFQEPEGLRRKRSFKITFKPHKDYFYYFAQIEGDSGLMRYKGRADVVHGVVKFNTEDRSGSINFKGRVFLKGLIKGSFTIGSSLFPAASGKWSIRKVK